MTESNAQEQDGSTATAEAPAPAVDATPRTATGVPIKGETKKVYLAESMVWNGEHYGPGYVQVPDKFPDPTGDDAKMTEDAADMEEFKRWQAEKRKFAGATNDAGVTQPESGEQGVPTTATGSNQGAQTGVVETSTIPDGAAGSRENDPLNPATPNTTAPQGTRAARAAR